MGMIAYALHKFMTDLVDSKMAEGQLKMSTMDNNSDKVRVLGQDPNAIYNMLVTV